MSFWTVQGLVWLWRSLEWERPPDCRSMNTSSKNPKTSRLYSIIIMDDSSGTCPYTPPEWWVINGHNMIGKLWHQLCTRRSKCQWLVVHAVATAREVKNVKSPCPYSANWGALKSPKTNELTLEAAGQTKRPAQFALRGCSLQGAVRLSYDYSLFKAQIDLMGSISPSQGITLADSSEPCWNLGVCWNLRPD